MGLVLALVLLSIAAIQAQASSIVADTAMAPDAPLAAAAYATTGGGIITGTVSTPDANPIPPGTVVRLYEPGSWDVKGWASVSAGDPSFSIGPVPNGLYVLKAIPPAGSPYTQSEPKTVSVFNANVYAGELWLTFPQVVGTVLDPTGTTPTQAEVRVYAGSGMVVQVTEAPTGTFKVGGLPVGNYALQAFPLTDDPYWKSDRVPITITSGTLVLSTTLTLNPADLWGWTKDSTGAPVPDATVVAVRLGSAGSFFRADRSSPSGFWAIGGLPHGDYRLTAHPSWRQAWLIPPAPITVTLPGATNPYTLTFHTPPKVVTGTVQTNTGDPVFHAQVVAHRVNRSGRAMALTGADGKYTLNLAPGLWALTVRPISITTPSHWVYPQPPQLVAFPPNTISETKRLDFEVLTADARVTGTVEMPDGSTPPFTVTVVLHSDEGVGVQGVISPTDGSFDIAVPNGDYQVWVRPEDPRFMGPVVPPVHVPPSSTVSVGTLTLLARDALITGTVTDESGAAVEGIPVIAWRAGAPGGARTHTNADGQYQLPVAAGEWMVRPAPAPDQPYLYTGMAETVMLTSSETVSNVDFSLVTADATLEGVLVTEDGTPATDAEGWAQATHVVTPSLHKGAPIHDGTFTILLPAGTYNVSAHLSPESPYMSAREREVTLASGETKAITLTVQKKDAAIAGFLWNPRAKLVVPGVHGMVAAWAGGNGVATPINVGNGTYTMTVAAGLWNLGFRIDPTSGYVPLLRHKSVAVQSGQTVPVPLPIVPRDGLITGTVLGPTGNPVAGAVVIADGAGPEVQRVVLKARSGPDGRFRLEVPHGLYHLGATVGPTTSVKPGIVEVLVPAHGASGGHTLQFRKPDAVINGSLTISGTSDITGTVFVWAWSDDDGFVKGHFPVTSSTGVYGLHVVSNTTWHLGAVYETSSLYWIARADVTLGSGGATQDLVLTGPHPKPGPVAVTFDAAEPQRVELADGTSIYIPANAMPVSGTVTLQIVPIATLPHQRRANVLKYGYAFTAMDESGEPITDHFNQEVIIRFPYDEDELRRLGISEARLRPAYYSTTEERWTLPNSFTVDTANNTVTMQIDHFTDFALTGEVGYDIFLPVVMRNR